METRLLIGALVVGVAAFYRFNTVPSRRAAPDGLSGWRRFVFGEDEAVFELLPPPRANTTLFKFWIHRMAYVCTGLAVYFALCLVPGLLGEVERILHLVVGGDTFGLVDAGPLLIAFVVIGVFPRVPPFRAGEVAMRQILYEYASIPAQQISERNRLREAAYDVDPATLETVRSALRAEDFDPDDLVYEAIPTTRSLWTKVSVLLAHLAAWQGDDRYKTALATLRERDSDTRSMDRVNEMYDALKPNARMYLQAIRARSRAPETAAREAVFRMECKELLGHVYALISRVSLKSHFTERERITAMKQVGFRLTPRVGGPLPDPNDLVALAIVLALALFLPLAGKVGPLRAVVIAALVYTAVLTPILLATQYPSLALRANRTPALAFPAVAGVAVAVLTMGFDIVYGSLRVGLAAPTGWFDLSKGWALYSGRTYPWTSLLALIAVLIAVRIRSGVYPDPASLTGVARYREWGSVRDAGLFLVCAAGLMLLFVQPRLAQLWGDPARAAGLGVTGIPSVMAAVIGFFVPTWYRANAARILRAHLGDVGAPGAPTLPRGAHAPAGGR